MPLSTILTSNYSRKTLQIFDNIFVLEMSLQETYLPSLSVLCFKNVLCYLIWDEEMFKPW